MNVIVDRPTGEEVARFADYMEAVVAVVYRRDVLCPTVDPERMCRDYPIHGTPA